MSQPDPLAALFGQPAVHSSRWAITDTTLEYHGNDDDALPGTGDLIVDCSIHGPIGRIEAQRPVVEVDGDVDEDTEYDRAVAVFVAHVADAGEADPALSLDDALAAIPSWRSKRTPPRSVTTRVPHDTYRGRALPAPGTMVRTAAFRVLDHTGPHHDHWTGRVLWAHAYLRVVTETWTDDRGAQHSRAQSFEHLDIQLDDGREARLGSDAPGDAWSALTDDEIAAHDAVLTAADALDAQAATLDGYAARTLRTQARDMRTRAGVRIVHPSRAARPLGPQRPSALEVLEQDALWWPAGRGPIAVADMGPRHVRNTIKLLERNARNAHAAYAGSSVFADAPDDVHWSLASEDPSEWLDEQPMMVALRARAAHDAEHGVPDEPPPTDAELAGWRERNGLDADGSEDHQHPNPSTVSGAR